MPQRIDELTPIAEYMVREMTHNLWTPPALRIRELNSIEGTCTDAWVKAPWWKRFVTANPKDCADLGVTSFFIACHIWYNQVKTNGPWDHKPIIRRRQDLRSKSTGGNEWHVYGETAYNFDVWSNVHYGYVGSAIGFSASVLLDGAGAAQAMSDTELPKKWPRGTGPSMRPRRWDRPEDRISIALGVDLWRQFPDHINAPILVRAVVNTDGILKKPASEVRKEVQRPQHSVR